jgi:predicted AlkP superfamily phosphohydrolase/phosphomutase
VRAWAALGREGTLVVLSDHGAAPFRTAVHLNALLRERGFLRATGPGGTSGELFKEVDWPRTRAYAAGFNAVYLNRAGREGRGVVGEAEAPGLLRELAAALESYTDPESGERPIRKVYETAGAGADRPDLVVGYARGYRASWETALGKVPEAVLAANTKKWSGDHCIDPAEVPGVFLSSDAALDAAALQDVGPRLAAYLRGR